MDIAQIASEDPRSDAWMPVVGRALRVYGSKLISVSTNPNPDPDSRYLSRYGNVHVTIKVHICMIICSTWWFGPLSLILCPYLVQLGLVW